MVSTAGPAAHRGDREMPTPSTIPGVPVLGNAGQIAQAPFAFFRRAHERHGPVFRIRLYRQPFTVVSGRGAIDFLLANGEAGLSRQAFYRDFARELGADRFVLAEPPDALPALRRATRLGYAREVSNAHLQTIHRTFQQRLEAFDTRPRPALDLGRELAFYAYAHVLCGDPLLELYEPASRYARTIMNVGTGVWPGVTLKHPGYRRAKTAVFHRIDAELDRRMASGSDASDGAYTLLDALAAADPAGQEVTRGDLLGSALYGFVGSIVYMDRAIAFLLYELLKDPAMRARAQDEADTAFANGSPDQATLNGLSCLRCAFREALRLHPVALAQPYVADTAMRVCGHRIEPGERVLFAPVTEHFEPANYRDPFAFDPDRFRPPRNAHKEGAPFIPFGFGPRSCNAIGLVETIALTVVAALFHRRAPAMDPPDYTLRTTINPLPGPRRDFRVRLHYRTDRSSVTADRARDTLRDARPPISSKACETMLRRGTRERHAPGATIIREGEVADVFYILLEGSVRVTRASGDREIALATLGSGQPFGEIGLLQGRSRTASVTVTPDASAEVLALDRDAFTRILAECDLTADEIARLAHRRHVEAALGAGLTRVSADQRDRIAERADLKRYQATETVVRQGHPADAFYVIASGRAAVVRDDGGDDHDGEVLDILESGQFFGEVGLLHGSPRTATVKAHDETLEVVVVDRATFYETVATDTAIGIDVAAIAAQRLMAM